MAQAARTYNTATSDAYSLAVGIVSALERANAADERGQPWAAAEFREQADRLRARLVNTSCKTPSDRIGHLVMVRHTAQQLVAELAAAIVGADLDGRALELMAMLDKLLGDGEDEPPGEDAATFRTAH